MSMYIPDLVCEDYDGCIVKNAWFEEICVFSDSLSDFDVIAGGKKVGLSSSETWFDCHTEVLEIENGVSTFRFYLTPSETNSLDTTEFDSAKFEVGIKHQTDKDKIHSLVRLVLPIYEDWAEKRG